MRLDVLVACFYMHARHVVSRFDAKEHQELSGYVLGACWGTEELGWSERSRKKLRDVRQQSNGFENYEL